MSALVSSMEPVSLVCFRFFFFNDTATTEIYTLSLHDALPICDRYHLTELYLKAPKHLKKSEARSEEHTSELQSPMYLVCRLLLEKNKKHVNILVAIVCTVVSLFEFWSSEPY